MRVLTIALDSKSVATIKPQWQQLSDRASEMVGGEKVGRGGYREGVEGSGYGQAEIERGIVCMCMSSHK